MIKDHIAKIIKDSTGMEYLDPTEDFRLLERILNDLLACQDNGTGFPDTLETWTRDGCLSDRDAEIVAVTLQHAQWYWKRNAKATTAR